MKLNQEEFPGLNLRLEVQEKIVRKDLSGGGSSGASSHHGYSPAEINLTCLVPFTQGRWITEIRRLFQALGEDGTPRVYRVEEPLCLAMGITQARFSGSLSVRPDNVRKLWNLSCTLTAEETLPKRIAERLEASDAGNWMPL